MLLTHLNVIEILRNYDGDGKGNVKKSRRFNEKNNNPARASRFFVHYFADPAKLTTWNDQILYYICLNSGAVPSIHLLSKLPSFK